MLNENVPLTLLYKVRENPIIRDKLRFLSEQDFDEAHSDQSGEGLTRRRGQALAAAAAHRPQPRSGDSTRCGAAESVWAGAHMPEGYTCRHWPESCVSWSPCSATRSHHHEKPGTSVKSSLTHRNESPCTATMTHCNQK